MNQRIRQLAEQAGITCVVPAVGTLEYSGKGEIEHLKKFAEMIVIECGNIISGLIVPETLEQDIGPYEKWNQALGHAALEIEQHFFGDAHE